MKKLILSFSFLLASVFVYSQIMFEKHYGGTSDEHGNYVFQTEDGGYIISGYTQSYGAGGHDIYIIKTDGLGNSVWTKTYGGLGDDQTTALKKTYDNGYIIGGLTSSFDLPDYNAYCIKINQNGDTLWTRNYGGNNYDDCTAILQTIDHGFALLGNTTSYGSASSSIYLIRINELGDTLWTKTYQKKISNLGSNIIQTNDGGFLITGTTSITFVSNTKDIFLIKTNISGDTLWTKVIGGSGDDWGFSALELSDGSIMISGVTNSYGAGGYDIFMCKLQSYGEEIWMKTYGGVNDEWGQITQQTNDLGYIITGSTNSFGNGNEDVYIIKTDMVGDTLWTRTFGGTGVDWGSCAQQTSDNGYIITGKTSSFGNADDIYLIKTNESGNVAGINDYSLPKDNRITIYPNPFSTSTQISFDKTYQTLDLSLIDLQGKIIQQKSYHDCNKITLDRAGIATGFYFLRVNLDGKFVETKKVVVAD